MTLYFSECEKSFKLLAIFNYPVTFQIKTGTLIELQTCVHTFVNMHTTDLQCAIHTKAKTNAQRKREWIRFAKVFCTKCAHV